MNTFDTMKAIYDSMCQKYGFNNCTFYPELETIVIIDEKGQKHKITGETIG